MQRAMEEMDRRRLVQTTYNANNGITPRGIEKSVSDIMEGAYSSSASAVRPLSKTAEKTAEYERMTTAQLSATVKTLEEDMYKHARDLEFEEAAVMRDQIEEIKSRYLEMPMHRMNER